MAIRSIIFISDAKGRESSISFENHRMVASRRGTIDTSAAERIARYQGDSKAFFEKMESIAARYTDMCGYPFVVDVRHEGKPDKIINDGCRFCGFEDTGAENCPGCGQS